MRGVGIQLVADRSSSSAGTHLISVCLPVALSTVQLVHKTGKHKGGEFTVVVVSRSKCAAMEIMVYCNADNCHHTIENRAASYHSVVVCSRWRHEWLQAIARLFITWSLMSWEINITILINYNYWETIYYLGCQNVNKLD